MALVIPHRAITAVSQSKDPKQTIFDIVGDLNGFRLLRDDVLLGIYIRPEKTAGGILRPDSNVQEDMWQGKVGLVLKLGPTAFRNAETGELYDERIDVGSWAGFWPSDAKAVQVNGYPCRIIKDVRIGYAVNDPEIVF